MTKLTCVLPFYPGDLDQAKTLLHWIAELGGCGKHFLLLVADSRVPVEDLREMLKNASPHFENVHAITVVVNEQHRGWPKAFNKLFLNASRYIQSNYKTPFLWMETDAIPLKNGWLDQLASEYESGPRRYMGTIMENSTPGVAKYHLNGVAIYPNDAWSFWSDKLVEVDNSTIPLDAMHCVPIVSASANTLLMMNVWGEIGKHPILVEDLPENPTPQHITFREALRPGAVLFHRDKHQALIPYLREKLKHGKIASKQSKV